MAASDLKMLELLALKKAYSRAVSDGAKLPGIMDVVDTVKGASDPMEALESKYGADTKSNLNLVREKLAEKKGEDYADRIWKTVFGG